MTDPAPDATSSGRPSWPAYADIVRGNRMVALVAIGALALLAIAAVVLAFTLGPGASSPGVSSSPRSLSAQPAR
jgi:hypothetical protein